MRCPKCNGECLKTKWVGIGIVYICKCCHKIWEIEKMKDEDLEELKSEIDLMKEVIIALAKITVNEGFNCNYAEKNKFYDLVSKMIKE